MVKLTFCGAARQVTGSMFLLELQDGYKILVDCGTDFETRGREDGFLFDPAEIDVVLLTHAHLDHSGKIPNLFAEGYSGQILCTAGTYHLTQLILQDAAAIYSKNLKRKLKRKRYGGRRVSDERDLTGQVEKASERFVTLAFNKRFEIRPDLALTFVPAGHLLGAAAILLEIKEDGTWKRIGFTGDLGRDDYPLLCNPGKMEPPDYLVSESTYGDRLHQAGQCPEGILEQIIKKACVEKRGRLIIPSFSVGRTQSLLFTLNKLALKGKLPPVKVFADSPMAEACTRIYESHLSLLNSEAKRFFEEYGSLFDFENLISIKTGKESKAINNYNEPCIILSSSGMITGGRIQEHIRKNLNNQYCTILLVGYCAEGTAGYSLSQGEKVITLKGKKIPVQAEVIYTDVFSGHADQNDLLRYIENHVGNSLKKIFLVHGEPEGMNVLKEFIHSGTFVGQTELPFKGQSYLL